MTPFEQFLVGHLNMDTDLIFGSADDAVLRFVARSPADVEAALAGVQALLERHEDDASLLAEAERMGCDYLPQAPGEFRRILVFATTTFAAAVAAARHESPGRLAG
jgi:CdiI immunity protein